MNLNLGVGFNPVNSLGARPGFGFGFYVVVKVRDVCLLIRRACAALGYAHSVLAARFSFQKPRSRRSLADDSPSANTSVWKHVKLKSESSAKDRRLREAWVLGACGAGLRVGATTGCTTRAMGAVTNDRVAGLLRSRDN